MALSRFFCRLPHLHPGLSPVAGAALVPAAALFLWPGLSHSPAQGYWSAPTFPFSAQAADGCLQQMEALGEAALAGVPMQTLASMDSAPEMQKKRQELHDIAAFAATGRVEGPSPEAVREKWLQAAQKALLWAWLLEEKVLEVRALLHSYSSNISQMVDVLGVEQDEGDSALSGLAALDRSLDPHVGIVPPWPLVLENAALFLPEDACIAVEPGLMAEDLRDRLPLGPASADSLALWAPVAGQPNLVEACVPLWQALGKSGPRAEQPWLARKCTFVLLTDCPGEGSHVHA